MPLKRRAIVWFRQDLRLSDNEALSDALAQAFEVIPVYVFDTRVFRGSTEYGFAKTGPYRASFILESVKNLQRSLRKLGSDLIIRIGRPEEEIFSIAQQVKSNWVFCNRERTPEEVFVQDQLERKLWSIGQELRFSRGKMLYHTGDLPFPIQHTPDTFSQFKKEVERYVSVREPLPAPQRSFNIISTDVDPGIMPDLKDFGHESVQIDRRADYRFKGGEKEALKRLKEYFENEKAVLNYKDTKDELSGTDFTSKLSPYLAQGCISPKQFYAALKEFEARHGESKSSEDLFHQLMYRDFLRFMVKKYGNIVFDKGGITERPLDNLSDDARRFEKWANGKTGVPMIDAGMNEFRQTGYISNRIRQNLASYLVHELEVNWQWGASFFESLLIDYDVCSNWMNWNAIAGLTQDPKDETILNPSAQATRYDPRSEYIEKWSRAQRSIKLV
ncbi:MAG TPA: DASH family cryptochrome [Saprospiraceae bacterium]|nr:DASH family cryptochrome [Saprospiraceae bacterium]